MSTPQASSRHCFVCGVANPFGLHLRFYSTAPGEVEARPTMPDQFEGYPGVVHGGIVAAMLDEAAGRSHMSGETPRFMFTAKIDIRYRRNVPVGQPLRLVGKAEKSRGRTATATSYIYDAQDQLLAEASALMVDLPENAYDPIDLKALGWRVYLDSELEGDA